MSSAGVEQESGNGSFVDRDLFRDVIGHFASGVTTITDSAVASLTLDPPMSLVCVNKETGTRYAITESGAFAVNILHEDQGDLAAKFVRPDTDKHQGVKVAYGELGELLLEDVLAHQERLGAKTESAMVVRSQQPSGVVLTATSIWTER